MRIVVRLLRRVLGIAPLAISADQALTLARAECDRRGWPWHEPVHIEEATREFRIRTSLRKSGQNYYIAVDGRTGAILRSGLITGL